MARSWIIDSRALARKVKSATQAPSLQIKDCGASRECPKCHCHIDNSDVGNEWPGLPVGVKFDPTDVQILTHLAAKCGEENSKSHIFIDEFIPTLEGDKGICYTHPENLPGAKKDGNSIHFFHRTINAYSTGQRKRRKIHRHGGSLEELVRWHKTGKTKAVMENGIQKGNKKIMVLYTSSKGTKPDKSNWVMHQYHLGIDEDEKEGEFVVSKIFYQQVKPLSDNHDERNLVIKECDTGAIRTSPRTPKINTPNPPRHAHSIHSGPPPQETKEQTSKEVVKLDQNNTVDSLLCKEVFDPSSALNHPVLEFFPSQNNFLGDNQGCSIADLENLELLTPPDFQLSDLHFSSQDSIFGWLDWM